MDNKMNVFLDCGWYSGWSWNLFKKTIDYKNDFICYAFDPFPKKCEENKDVIFVKKVVWIFDGEIDFHTSSRRGGRANSIYKNPKAIKEKKRKIECIDLSKFIINNFKQSDFIVLKMDVEGAENDILEKMAKDDTLKFVNILYLEPHNKDEKYKKNICEIKNNQIDYRTAIEWCFKKYLKT